MKGGKSCAYCGREADTRDHVPPKALFPSPRPSTLISVPSCRACNAGFSLDDDYARMAMVIRADVAGHFLAKELIEPTFRGLARPEQRGFARSVVEAVTVVPLYNRDGILVGNAPALNVDLQRLRNTAERTVRGLYFHYLDRRLEGQIKVWIEEDIGALSPDERTHLNENILGPLYRSEMVKLGGDVLSIWRVQDSDVPDATAWLLQFFGAVRFLALTAPSIDSKSRLRVAAADGPD